jgi:hypothetical protein
MGLFCAFVAIISVFLSLNPRAFMARNCNMSHFYKKKNSVSSTGNPSAPIRHLTPEQGQAPSAISESVTRLLFSALKEAVDGH